MYRNEVSYDWPFILAYHSVSEYRHDALTVNVAAFENQMAWLHRHGYRSITLAEFMTETIEMGERIAILTFDDGYADNYTLAFPILKRYGFVATIFLVSDYVNTDHVFLWDVPKIASPSDQALYRLLTWQEVREMADYGIEFGSHTCSHSDLTHLPAELCMEELTRSGMDLQSELGCEIVSFCYPRGKCNAEVTHMVEKAGYRCAVVTPTCSGMPLSYYTLRRIGIYHANAPWLFRLKTTPFVRRNYERFKRQRWTQG